MKNYKKYERGYFLPPVMTNEWVNKEYIEVPPKWCSVDLRDGNQALIEPMSFEEKLEFFKMLVEIGFKEIEVGFPAASDTEFNFMRALIDRKMIPDDVTVQVLTQAREHIIRKTFEAVKGAPHAVIHLYNSTSVAQREQVFRKSKEDIKKIAVNGAKLLKQLGEETEGNFTFQYSPESFSGTEVDYALEVCNDVLDVWKPSEKNKVIINVPSTVQNAMPHIFANQVEYMSKNLKYRENVILCIHAHNDRGTGIAEAELGVLAGADRVEGTLFGNGERTGNVDIVTLALNMYSHGVDPGLDFSNLMEIKKNYEKYTGMIVPQRQPYAGELVFTAFSGSHQDAIAKGMKHREENRSEIWNVPYLPIDPSDIGRKYESDVIRINSQSGKGGISYILKENYGITIPEEIREEVGYTVKGISDREHKELSPERVYNIFQDKYINNTPIFQVVESHFKQVGGIVAEVVVHHNGQITKVKANGNGRLNSVSNAIKQYFGVDYDVSFYEEHSLTKGSSSKAVSYVGVTYGDEVSYGVGIDEDIIRSSINALVVAVNNLPVIKEHEKGLDGRLNDIMNYIQENYTTVTLEELSDEFHLSKPYISKYIKDKSGETYGEIVKTIRMNKARTLLKNSAMTVENIAGTVGYENVEHFNRLFKKQYSMTPIQYRNSK